MSELVIKFLESAPPLAVLVIFAWIGLKHVEKRDELLKIMNQEHLAAWREAHAEHLASRSEMRAALKENSESTLDSARRTAENTEAIRSLEKCFARMERLQ